VSDDEDDVQTHVAPIQLSTAIVTRMARPPYGQRSGWKPTLQEDFGKCRDLFLYIYLNVEWCSGDGGAYPECHIAQYPLAMGKKKVSRLIHKSSLLRTISCLRPPLATRWLSKSIVKGM
jgi:SNW domain-containing protein 1